MSNSPQQAKSNLDKTDPKVQFKTENIGSWASRQENPFAKQNRERQAKKQERDKKRQKAAPFFVTFASAAVIGVALWGLVMLVVGLVNGNGSDIAYTPEISGSSTQDINSYRDLLQKFYEEQREAIRGSVNTDESYGTGTSGGNNAEEDKELISDVDAAVNNTLKTPDGRKNANAVKYAQMLFYLNNGYYQETVKIGEQVDSSLLDSQQLLGYYDAMANSYYLLGDMEKSDSYYKLLTSLPVGEGGEGA